MPEYIERERLLRRFNVDDMMNVNGTLISLNDARNVISNFPASDVAPIAHGEWLDRKGGFFDFAVCSNCKEDYPLGGETINYCPYCGAKMDGVRRGMIKEVTG